MKRKLQPFKQNFKLRVFVGESLYLVKASQIPLPSGMFFLFSPKPSANAVFTFFYIIVITLYVQWWQNYGVCVVLLKQKILMYTDINVFSGLKPPHSGGFLQSWCFAINKGLGCSLGTWLWKSRQHRPRLLVRLSISWRKKLELWYLCASPSLSLRQNLSFHEELMNRDLPVFWLNI